MKVAIIGAGPAGLTAAYQLSKAGVEVEVFEASSDVGGLSRSLSLWGQTVDLGPHRFFSSDARVNRLWLEVVGRDYRMVERLTRIYYGGQLFQYPLEAWDALCKLGIGEATRCVASFIRQQALPGPDQGTFESWVVRRFGRRLFDIFFKSYSEKLWGIPCDQLDADFAAQRIKKLSLAAAIRNSLGAERARHRTLVDEFAYPIGGTGMVYERMAEMVQAVGQIHLETTIRRVIHDNGQVTGIEKHDGQIERFDHIVSTMPLTNLVRGLGGVPPHVERAAQSLTFRNTVLVYLHVAAADIFPDQWVYMHSSDLGMGRVTNFRNWVPELYGSQESSILAVEYWCYEKDEQWQAPDDAWIARAADEIQTTGLLGSAKIDDGRVVRIPKSYPVYAKGYQEHLSVVEKYLSTLSGLTPIGRYGAFKYNNQDHSILMGILAAENILEQQINDLWSVNTDYETYQESATITESGLQLAEA